eukprot:TRINITY_DN996_c0_g1_i2.p1 TRINITY_DN996_c0_g1~~TRINITY_DN996_c0_g1_i2.p1  ORF type:complete len:114 (+),score=8.34 TRINITY_DN996_c0_g1_i2:70-411(+)
MMRRAAMRGMQAGLFPTMPFVASNQLPRALSRSVLPMSTVAMSGQIVACSELSEDSLCSIEDPATTNVASLFFTLGFDATRCGLGEQERSLCTHPHDVLRECTRFTLRPSISS